MSTLTIYSYAQYGTVKDNPIELGKVNWLRDYDKAIALSKEESKPIFILFQEVPGCNTCTTYGKSVMSHPLIVEAIETYFVPLAIYNNKGGADAQILKKYGEPSWNNPVVRIVDNQENDIVNRLNGAYTIEKVANGIADALVKRAINIPTYLKLLIEEHDVKNLKSDYFSMYCFWSGEGKLGSLEGVVDTKAGFMDGHEVVKVTYDPAVISAESLVSKAKDFRVAEAVYTDNKQTAYSAKDQKIKVKNLSKFRLDKEPKYQIQRAGLAHVPMTYLQASKVNAAIYAGKNFTNFLSPRQLIIAQQDPKNRNFIEQDISKVWWSSM